MASMALVAEQDGPGTRGDAGADPAVGVLVVDDHEFFRSGVVGWLRNQPGIECHGEAGTLAEARERLADQEADVMLLDLSLPDGDGLEFIREALLTRPSLRIIVLSQRDEEVFAERAMRRGAHGYLMKSEASDQLLEAIRAVTGGGTWLSRAAWAQADPMDLSVKLRRESSLGELSDRELQVFALVGGGHGPKEIAGLLGISTKTVEAHREHIRHKLGLKDAGSLTRVARRWVQAGRV